MQASKSNFTEKNYSRHASALAKTINRKISVRKTEKLASKRKVSPQLKNIQDKLSRLIGEKVVINQNAKTKKVLLRLISVKKQLAGY